MSLSIEETTELIETEPEISAAATTALVRRNEPEAISGARKAAILCLSLGEDAAASVLKHLSEEEVQLVSKELALLGTVKSEIADTVVTEFYQLMLARDYVAAGGVDFAKRLLVKSFGADTAKRMTDKVLHALETPASFDALKKVDAQQLSKLFQAEHPQTIAVVLAHLDAQTAAAVLENLSDERRSEIVLRLANLQTVSQDVVRRIAQMLEQKLSGVANLRRTSIGGVRSVAEICNRLDREIARQMLEEIESRDSDLSLEIRNMMLTFDDLLLIDDIGIREILQRVDKKVLALALKGTMPELQERFFSNMSSRAVEMMREEMDFMGQVKLKDVTAAQREIIEILRALEEEGVVSIAGGGGGADEYVS